MSTQSLKPGWKMVKFGDIAQNVAVRVDPADAKTDVYVGLEHLDPSTLHLRQWGQPSDVTGQKLAFKKGDVIFGRRRAYQRKLAVAEFDGICSAHAMVVRAKPKMILPEFLPFFLQSDMFMERAIEISVGSLSPTINWKTLKVQEFPLPPLDEQKQIAEILWVADEAVETFDKLLREHSRATSVLRGHLFEEVSGDDSTLGQLVKAGELDIQTGPFGTVLSASSYVSSGTPIFNPVHMKEDGILDTESGPFISAEDVTRLARYQMQTGDVLLSRKGEMGRVSIIEEDLEGCLVGSDCMRFRFSTKRVLPQFVFEYWHGPRQQSWFERFASGTTMPGLNEPSLHLMPIHIPTLTDQLMLVEKFEDLHRKKKKIKNHLLAQRALRKTLIGSLLEGATHV